MCVYVYYVFVRYIHVNTMRHAICEILRNICCPLNVYSAVCAYDICRHAINRKQTHTRTENKLETLGTCVLVCIKEYLRMKLLVIFMFVVNALLNQQIVYIHM